MVLAAVKMAQPNAQPAVTPTGVLESIVLGRFQADITQGKTLVRMTEAGGDAGFALMADMSPAEIVALAMEAITWIQTQPDPLNPNIYPPKRIKRLRVSFAKGTI
jgi:hypothetical protein